MYQKFMVVEISDDRASPFTWLGTHDTLEDAQDQFNEKAVGDNAKAQEEGNYVAIIPVLAWDYKLA